MLSQKRRDCLTLVEGFADTMYDKLVEKIDWSDRVGRESWGDLDLDFLTARLYEELSEFWNAVDTGIPDDIKKEAADVANFLAFICAKFKAL